MKAKGCAVLGCLPALVLAVAVSALLGLGALSRRTEEAPAAPPVAEPTAEPVDEPTREPVRVVEVPPNLEPMRPFKVRTAAPPRPGESTPAPAETAPPTEPHLVPMQPFRVRTPLPPRDPTAPPVEPPPMTLPPAPEPEHFAEQPGEWRLFAREEAGGRYRMQYGFVDYAGRRHRVTCSIGRDAVERASGTFGLNQTEVIAEIKEAAEAAVARELHRRGLAGLVSVSVQGLGGWRMESTEGAAERADEVRALESWLRGDYARIFERFQDAAFSRRGLILRGRTIDIDHNGVAKAATDDLRECYDALLAAGGAASERTFMGLMVAFFQELKYELPPDHDGPRHTFGFWVPARVVADGKGDCDSKAVAFAALWRRRSSRVIVVRVPEHALLGVEARPGPGERVVRLGNRYYVLCEVAGPRKRPPGSTDVSGTFEFVEIDPL